MISIDKLSGDAARLILKSLVESGQVDEECVTNSIKLEPSADFKRLTDTLHTLFCRRPHRLVGEDNYCTYLEEDQVQDCWSLPAHQLCLNLTIKFMEEYKIANEIEFTMLYGKAKHTQEILNKLRVDEPRAYDLLKKMNGWED